MPIETMQEVAQVGESHPNSSSLYSSRDPLLSLLLFSLLPPPAFSLTPLLLSPFPAPSPLFPTPPFYPSLLCHPFLLPCDTHLSLAQGRVWTGKAALERGLVDALGGVHRAIAVAKQLAEIPEEERVTVLELGRKRSSPLALLCECALGGWGGWAGWGRRLLV
jgi:hypothetical protein